jgi:hypothetical protein
MNEWLRGIRYALNRKYLLLLFIDAECPSQKPIIWPQPESPESLHIFVFFPKINFNISISSTPFPSFLSTRDRCIGHSYGNHDTAVKLGTGFCIHIFARLRKLHRCGQTNKNEQVIMLLCNVKCPEMPPRCSWIRALESRNFYIFESLSVRTQIKSSPSQLTHSRSLTARFRSS